MSAAVTSELETLFKRGGNQVHLSATFCLLWIAAADGVIDDREKRLIASIAGRSHSTADVAELLALVRRRDIPSFVAACQVLRQTLTKEGRLAFVTLVIELATVDRRLSISENHLCRLFGDLLDFGASELQRLYQSITGGDLPHPGDPSSVAWWHSRTQKQGESRESAKDEEQENRSKDRASSGKRTKRDGLSPAEAYVVLGLRPSATAEEIKKAYRRAAQAHHPDRFAELGPEAQRAAHDMFVRIQHAYEMLS